MSETSSSSSNSGIGFCGLLTIVFITLKLLGKIDWSWWWVLSPIWMPAALVVAVVCFIGGGAVAVKVVEEVGERRRRKRLYARETLSLRSSPVPANKRDNNVTRDGTWLH